MEQLGVWLRPLAVRNQEVVLRQVEGMEAEGKVDVHLASLGKAAHQAWHQVGAFGIQGAWEGNQEGKPQVEAYYGIH